MVELEIRPTAGARIRVLVIMAIGAIIILTLIFLLTGGGTEIFSSKATLSAFMADATGLSDGTGASVQSEVRLSGIRIGLIDKVELSGSLDPQRVVRVDMRVNERYLKSIPRDSVTSVDADNPLGADFISIAEGKSPLPIPDHGVLVSRAVKPAGDSAALVAALKQELQQVDSLLAEVSSGKTTIGQFIVGSEAYDTVLARVSSFDRAIHAFVGPGSPLGQALFSEKLYNQVHTRLLQVDGQLSAIQRGDGPGGRLFTSDAQYNDVVKQLRDLRKSLADTGAGLKDDTQYENARRMLAATDALLTSLNAGEGAAGQLLANPQLYESLNGSLHNIEVLTKDLREHPHKYLRYKIF